jgi:hypothetical protein
MRGQRLILAILAVMAFSIGAIHPAFASMRHAGKWEMVGSTFDFPVAKDGEQITIPYGSKAGHGVMIGVLQGNLFKGQWFWLTPLERKLCPSARRSSTYWGTITLTFDNSGKSFSADWRMCEGYVTSNVDPGKGIWPGQRLSGPPEAETAGLDKDLEQDIATHRETLEEARQKAQQAGEPTRVKEFVGRIAELDELKASLLEQARTRHSADKPGRATDPEGPSRPPVSEVVDERMAQIESARRLWPHVSPRVRELLETATANWALDIVQARIAAAMLGMLSTAQINSGDGAEPSGTGFAADVDFNTGEVKVEFSPGKPIEPKPDFNPGLEYLVVGSTSVSFTTNMIVDIPDLTSLAGNTYTLEFNEGRFIEPFGASSIIGSILETELSQYAPALGVSDITMTMGVLKTPSKDLMTTASFDYAVTADFSAGFEFTQKKGSKSKLDRVCAPALQAIGPPPPPDNSKERQYKVRSMADVWRCFEFKP